MPAKVLRRAQFALKEAMAGEDAEGGEVDKPKPKPRGRPKAKAKGKGKAKPKSCSKKPMPDRCPNEGLPKADTYGSDVGVCHTVQLLLSLFRQIKFSMMSMFLMM